MDTARPLFNCPQAVATELRALGHHAKVYTINSAEMRKIAINSARSNRDREGGGRSQEFGSTVASPLACRRPSLAPHPLADDLG